MDRDVERELGGMAKLINAVAANQQKMAEAMRLQQQQAAADKILEAVTKIVSVTYDKGIAYTNLIIVAGYAGFFALWGATKPVLTDWVTITAALLILFSVSAFVGFEVFKMIHNSLSLFRHQGLLNDPVARKDPVLLQAKIAEFEALQQKNSIRLVSVWIAVTGFAILTGLLAVLCLASNYFQLLLLGYGIARLFV